MPDVERFVADTNILVSRLFFCNSLPPQAVRRAMSASQLIVSTETLLELEEVLSRPKFDISLSFKDRGLFESRPTQCGTDNLLQSAHALSSM